MNIRFWKLLFVISILAFISTQFSICQTVILSEDFSTASGTTPPVGWTIETAVGDPLIDLWHFDNPGRRIPNTPISSNFACFDSDKLSDNGLAEEVYLVSPVFDATISDEEEIWLEFSEFFVEGYDGFCSVEVYNGNTWIAIYSNNQTTSNPFFNDIEITTEIKNITNAKLRFKWIGNFSYYWIIDNIKIKIVPTSLIFVEHTGMLFQSIYFDPYFHNDESAFGDIDNDGDLDLLITGGDSYSYYTTNPITKLYINYGGNFIEDVNCNLMPVHGSSVKFCDFNNDGFLDLIIGGINQIGRASTKNTVLNIYLNNTDGTFTYQSDIQLVGISNGLVDVADYDNDGDSDLLTVGWSATLGKNIAKVYRNLGNNIFSAQDQIILTEGSYIHGGWFDSDQDGFLDILIDNQLFLNDGNNCFSKIETSIANLSYPFISFCDYDNDGDIDILAKGKVSANNFIYLMSNINNTNSFTAVSHNLPAIVPGSTHWIDFNNDGKNDVLLSGKPYSNLGNNSFSEELSNITNNTFALWCDYDNDGDLDIFNAGSGRIYKNLSQIVNSLPTAPLNIQAEVYESNVQLSWDNSSDNETPENALTYNIQIGTSSGGQNIKPSQSLPNGKRCILGSGNAGSTNSYQIKNLKKGTYYWSVQAIDGGLSGGLFSSEGQFAVGESTQASLIYFNDIGGSAITASWTRGSGDGCLLIGREGTYENITVNDNQNYAPSNQFGSGDEIGNSGWYCLYNGELDKITIENLKAATNYVFKVIEYELSGGDIIYNNNVSELNPNEVTTSWFTYLRDENLTCPYNGNIILIDYNSDTYLDPIITGYISGGTNYNLYGFMNYSNWGFNLGISRYGVISSSIEATDYNNDNCIDFIQTGLAASSAGSESPLQKNNCNSGYSASIFENIKWTNSSIVSLDYDNNGDQDIIISGNGLTKIFKNNNHSFIEEDLFSIIGLSNCNIECADYNNDLSIDIIVSGYDGTKYITRLYKNDGDGKLIIENNQSFDNIGQSSLAWGDYDNDGFLDILITGNDGLSNITAVYRNTGYDFIKQTQYNLTGVSDGTALWGDFDGDNYLDILISGSNEFKIYKNNLVTFDEVTNLSFHPRSRIRLATGDLDNDNDLDIVSVGSDYTLAYLYRNDFNNQAGMEIDKPNNLTVSFANNQSTLHWGNVLGKYNEENIYTYNVEIWNNDSIFCSSNSNSDGSRKIVALGNAQKNNSYLIKNLPLGTYFWRVQAINNSYIGGPWSETESFIVKELQADFVADTICLGDSTRFIDNSVFAGLTIENYYWDFGDGSIDSIQNLKHLYQNPGNYLVKYKVSSENFVDSIEKTVVIKNIPNAKFNISPSCVGDTVHLYDLSEANGLNIISTYWELGDGKFSSLKNVTNTYLNGNYHVKLKSTSDNGCFDTVSHNLQVVEYPSVILSSTGATEFCRGNSLDISVPYKSFNSYQWFKDNISISNADSSFIKINTHSGNYFVKAINEVAGCIRYSDTLSVLIYENPSNPTISFNDTTTFCAGDSLMLLTIEESGISRQWKNNNGYIGDGLQITVNQSGKYTITAINSITGCATNSFDTVKITVNPKPETPSLSYGNTTVCSGNSVTFIADTSQSGLTYQWKNGNENIAGATSYQYSATALGSYWLRVKNSNSCTASTIPVAVTLNESPNSPIIEALGDTIFCPGDSAVLTTGNNPELSYHWYYNGYGIGTNSPNFTSVNQGVYSLMVTNSKGCDALSVNKVTVKHYAVPQKPIIYYDVTSFCQGDSVQLSTDAVLGSEAQWYLNNQLVLVKNTLLQAKLEGLYHIELINENACKTQSIPLNLSTWPSPNPVPISQQGVKLCQGESQVLSVQEQQGFSYQWYKDGVEVEGAIYAETTVDKAGVYSVKISNEHNCSYSPKSSTAKVYTVPKAQSIVASGVSHICPDDELTLSVENNSQYSYQWYFKSRAIVRDTLYRKIAGEQGIYEVDIFNRDNTQCKTSTPVMEITYKDALPKPTLLAEGPNVWVLACDNNTAQEYRWYYNGNLVSEANEYMYVANQNLGEYYVSVSNGGECSVPSNIVTLPLNVTGITEANTVFGNIKIYPNPTPGMFTIEMDNQIIGTLYIRIVSEQGKELFNIKHTKTTTHLQTQMDLSGQGSGVYFIEFRFEGDRVVRKVVVE